MNYSNPRTEARFDDWPSGSRRTTCTFHIESDPKRGERAVRITWNPKTGRECAPKKLTYSPRQLIVTGDDERTYIIGTSIYGTLYVMRSDMQIMHESIPRDDERYIQLAAMFALTDPIAA